MYGEADVKRALTARSRVMTVAWLIGALALVLTVLGLVFRIKPLAQTALILGGCAVYSWFSLKVAPWNAYLRFLREMKAGLARETLGTFVAAGEESRMVDGVSVHDVLLDAGADANLLFYWDDDKPRPGFARGERLKVSSFGKFITSCERIGGPEGA